MKYMKYLLYLLILQTTSLIAVSPDIPEKDLKSPPPRIIRACCAFGYDLNLVGIPFMSITHITSIKELGTHKYLGGNTEGNGLIYTKNGGFIDLGHLRDQCDWTKYLYTLILQNRQEGNILQKLGYEGGSKNLSINVSPDMDSSDCLLLAGKIAFDLSLWHELSTWFGASYIPMMPERYSSFSVEDVYSNILGVNIAMEAIKSGLPYNEAVTKTLASTLENLEAVQTEEETREALEVVRNLWWTNDKRLPSRKVTLERDTEVFTRVRPWIVPDSISDNQNLHILYVPKSTSTGELLTSYYELSIDLNFKFPAKEIFPNRDSRLITQDDFDTMLNRVSYELNQQGYTSYYNPEGSQVLINKDL
jgi:hypothetical protein